MQRLRYILSCQANYGKKDRGIATRESLARQSYPNPQYDGADWIVQATVAIVGRTILSVRPIEKRQSGLSVLRALACRGLNSCRRADDPIDQAAILPGQNRAEVENQTFPFDAADNWQRE